jgi:RNA polymerase sigma-70 factor (ECF subfamily)
VDDSAVAEEVAQDAWIGILEGISRFEGRSSLKTWMFRILTNRAKTRREREGRTIPFSDLAILEIEQDEPAVPAGRFRPPDAGRYPGGWADPPKPWEMPPEDQLLSREMLSYLRRAIQALPPGQRTILVLRDVKGWGSAEVCNVLNLSETNQRVLLHRARSKVRRALEIYSEGERSA